MTRYIALTAGVLVALGLSVVLGAFIGSIVGVKTTLTLSDETYIGKNNALVVSVYSSSSSGEIDLIIKNASKVFYISNVTSDPRSLLKALSVFNINATQSNYNYDMRLGIVYGTTRVKANTKVLSMLPFISQTLKFSIKDVEAENGQYSLKEDVTPGEAVIVFILGDQVEYSMNYTVSEVYRSSMTHILAYSGILIVAGLLLYIIGRMKT